MNLKEYQKGVLDTWKETDSDEMRAVLGLNGEAGEVAELFKKRLRGNFKGQEGGFEFNHSLYLELGDVFYYLAMICNQQGFDMEDVLQKNIEKLDKRHAKEQQLYKGDRVKVVRQEKDGNRSLIGLYGEIMYEEDSGILGSICKLYVVKLDKRKNLKTLWADELKRVKEKKK